jgi:hypothetical protein
VLSRRSRTKRSILLEIIEIVLFYFGVLTLPLLMEIGMLKWGVMLLRSTSKLTNDHCKGETRNTLQISA